jgi:hypothetical protein
MSSFSLIKGVAIANIEAHIPVDVPWMLTFERLQAVESPILSIA